MDADHFAAIIRQIVEQAGEITGSKLALALRSQVADWDARSFGSKNLRMFIEKHVSGVVVAGRSGMDLVYKHQTQLPEQKSKSKQLWTTWVSPFGRYTLLVDPNTGDIEQIPLAAIPPKNMQRLVSPSEADHLDWAKAFLDSHPQLQMQLAHILTTPKRQWWRQWYAEIGKIGHLTDWKEFRQAQLEDRLRLELRSLVNDDDQRAQAFSVIAQTNPASGDHSIAPKPRTGKLDLGKAELIQAIDQMSDAQMRILQEAMEILSNALQRWSK